MKLVVFPDLLKGRVNSYTKKDGTFVQAHDNGRQAAAPKPATKVGVRASVAKKAAPAAGGYNVAPFTADSAKDHAVQAGAKFRSGVGVFASAEAAHAHAAKLAGGKGGAFVMNHPDHGYHVVVNGANAQRMEKSGYRHAKELKTVLTAK